MEADPVSATFRSGDSLRVSMRWACAPGALCIAPIALILVQRLACRTDASAMPGRRSARGRCCGKRAGLRRHDCAHLRCQGRRIVEQAERGKMVPAAGVIAAALASADEDAGIGAARGLAHLDVDIIVVERDLARDGDPAEVRAEIERSGSKAVGFDKILLLSDQEGRIFTR
jgi:hypothetical protein